VALLLISGGYLAARLVSLAKAVNASVANVSQLQASAKFKDIGLFSSGLAALGKSATEANSIAHDPMLGPLEWLPGIGADFSTLKQLTGPAQELAATGQPVLKYLDQLRTQAASGLGFDSKSVHAFRDSFSIFVASLARTDESLKTINSANLHFGLKEKLPSIQENLHSTVVSVRHLEPLVKIFSAMLANPVTEQRWFVATQNLSEARGTGGLLGSYAILTVKNGKISLVEAGSDTKLLASGGVNHSALPVELNDVWGVDLNDWRDFNVSAHVPFTGQIIADSWSRAFGQKIDGVIFMGQGTVAEMVAATGPITVQGRTLTAIKTAPYLAKRVYETFPDPQRKNKFVADFMRELFAKLTTSTPDLPSLLAFVSHERGGDKVYAWSADAAAQLDNVSQGVSGSVTETDGSQTWFTLNNAGGNKLDAWLQLNAAYALGKCGTRTLDGFDGRNASMSVTVTNHAPTSGLPEYTSPRLDLAPGVDYTVGSNRTLLTVYAPVGATVTSMTINGSLAAPWQAIDRGHPIYVFELQIDPGATQTVKLSWIEPLVNLEGHSIQTVPSLTVPALLNPVYVRTSSSGFCPIR